MKTAPLSLLLFLALTSPALLAADPPAAPTRPNILLILADDLGFSDIGCYGGEIRTPHLDALAKGGLRFTQFYNTARCWPTRSALLTGYYPQQIRMDPFQRGTPAPVWMRVLPQYLSAQGYRSYHSGKWHLNVAPKPVAQAGFDHSYLLNDQNRYFSPRQHSQDDRALPAVKPESGYYATTAIADHAIECLREHAAKTPGQPFFQYLAFTSPHFPLHAPEADIARYRDRYLEGWDAVRLKRWQRLRELGIVNCELAPLDTSFTPRYFKAEDLQTLGPGELEHPVPWETLNDEQKRFQATKMAIHAAMVDRMDQEIGRVLDQVRAMGVWENTLILFLSDNGADATIMVRGDGHDPAASPGSAMTHLCIGPGWAAASNAPFRRHKIWVNEGGISTPLVVHWPRGITTAGQLRHTPGHVIDLVPTLLELTGAKFTDTWHGAHAPPLPGRSLVPALASDMTIPRDYLFFHHEGNRAIRVGDWKLVSASEDHDRWELFDLSHDRCEKNDLAPSHPQLLQQLTDRWQRCEDVFRKPANEGLPAAGKNAVRKARAAVDE